MPRPLMQYGVGQLEEMFAKGQADLKVLKQLEYELQYRNVPRAVALLSEVQAAMGGSDSATPSVFTRSQQPEGTHASAPEQPELWDRQPVPLVEAVAPVEKPRPISPAVKPPVQKLHSPTLPTISLEDAWKVLKASPGAAWESIEQTRRELVQQSHPMRLKPLSDQRRTQALADAKRVNAAYATLQRLRCGRT